MKSPVRELRLHSAAARRAGRPAGFALVLVLWLLVVLGAIALRFHSSARSYRNVAANAAAVTRAEWAARGGIARALAALNHAVAASSPGALSGASAILPPPLTFARAGVSVRVVAYDSRARVSLNHADRRTLERLLRGAGGTPGQTDRILAFIFDRRRTAARQDAAWRARFPGDTPTRDERFRARAWAFTTISQLRNAPGMTNVLYDRIAPHLTTAGDARINVNTAPAIVLAALPLMTRGAAEALVQRRRRASLNNVFEVVAALPGSLQRRARERLAAFSERIAFAPGTLVVSAAAAVQGNPARVTIRRAVRVTGHAVHPLPGMVVR